LPKGQHAAKTQKQKDNRSGKEILHGRLGWLRDTSKGNCRDETTRYKMGMCRKCDDPATKQMYDYQSLRRIVAKKTGIKIFFVLNTSNN